MDTKEKNKTGHITLETEVNGGTVWEAVKFNVNANFTEKGFSIFDYSEIIFFLVWCYHDLSEVKNVKEEVDRLTNKYKRNDTVRLYIRYLLLYGVLERKKRGVYSVVKKVGNESVYQIKKVIYSKK